MMTDQFKIPRIGIAVIIVQNNKILLGKRKNNSNTNGLWQFTGGKLDFNESWEDCARRETKEETNLDIKNIRFVSATNDINLESGKHYVTLFMIADYADGELKAMEPEKAEQWGWYDWDKMPRPLFMPIQRLLAQGYNPFKDNEVK